MDHEDPRHLVCPPDESQESREPAAPACVSPSDESAAAQSVAADGGGFRPPSSPASADLFSHWGGVGGDENVHGPLAAAGLGTHLPELPPGGGMPPSMLNPSTAEAAEEAAELVNGAAPAVESTAAEVGTGLAEAGGVGAAEVLAPLVLAAAGGYGAYKAYKGVQDPSYHGDPGISGVPLPPHDMGVDEPITAPGAPSQRSLDAPGAGDGAAKVDVPASTPETPANTPPQMTPVPMTDPDDGSALQCAGPNILRPDPKAEGPHSSFKRSPQSGRVSGHAEWDQDGLPIKRTDVIGKTHGSVATPHTHVHGPPNVDPVTGEKFPGNEVELRTATPDEIPKQDD